MSDKTASPFPCPFCRSRHVTLLGGGRQFLNYKCTECAEVWTAQRVAASSIGRASDDVSAPQRPRIRGKVSSH